MRGAPISNLVYESPWQREAHRQSARVVPPITDEQALAIADLARLTGEAPERRRVLYAHWKRRWEPPTRLAVAEKHVDDGVRQLLPTEPGLDDRARLVRPAETDRGAGVDDNDAARMC